MPPGWRPCGGSRPGRPIMPLLAPVRAARARPHLGDRAARAALDDPDHRHARRAAGRARPVPLRQPSQLSGRRGRDRLLPLVFGLWQVALLFSLLNALVLPSASAPKIALAKACAHEGLRSPLPASPLAGCATPGRAARDFFADSRRYAARPMRAASSARRSPPTPALPASASSCTCATARPTTIRIPFHVGDDRSRTWVVSRTADRPTPQARPSPRATAARTGSPNMAATRPRPAPPRGRNSPPTPSPRRCSCARQCRGRRQHLGDRGQSRQHLRLRTPPPGPLLPRRFRPRPPGRPRRRRHGGAD